MPSMKLTDSDVKTIETAQKMSHSLDGELYKNNPKTVGVAVGWDSHDPDANSYGSLELLEHIDAAMEAAGSKARTAELFLPIIHETLGDIGYFEDSYTESALYRLVTEYISADEKPCDLARTGLEVLHQELMAPYYRKASKLLVDHAHQSAVGFN